MPDSFTLLETRGKGAMGTVWKARDNQTGDTVAVKILHAHLADDPDYVARLEREVELARRIDSPNVVRVLGYGQRDGLPFMVMEFVDGPSLREVIRARGPLPWDGAGGAKEIAGQVAAGLAAAHGAGVIHRDVKPSNILIAPDGTAKLADFGISRALDLTRLTGSATVLGTPAYMAPDTEATEKSDLYSLGCVIYEMLTGAPPFTGASTNEVVARHFRESPDLSKLPEDARALLASLLAKDARTRPTAGAVFSVESMPYASSAAAKKSVLIAPAIAVPLMLLGIGLLVRAMISGKTVPPSYAADESTATAATNQQTSSSTAVSVATSTPTSVNTPAPTMVATVAPSPTLAATPTPRATDAPTRTPTPAPAPIETATPSTGTATPVAAFTPPPLVVVFQSPTSAYPAPGEADICWLITPPGARAHITISEMHPRSVDLFSEDSTADGYVHCFFARLTKAEIPTVYFTVAAFDASGKQVAGGSIRYDTYANDYTPVASTPSPVP